MALSFFPFSDMTFFLPDADVTNCTCLCRRYLLADSLPLTLGGAMLFWVSPDIMEATLLLLVGVVMCSGEGAVTASSADFKVAGDGMMV